MPKDLTPQKGSRSTAPRSTQAASKTQATGLRQQVRGMGFAEGAKAVSPRTQGAAASQSTAAQTATPAASPAQAPTTAPQTTAPTTPTAQPEATAGTVAHTTTVEADSAIRNHLERHVQGAVRSGRQIAGTAQVVDDAGWDSAGEAHYGPRWPQRRDLINGFVDSQGRVWIHQNRGNPGTMIHEAIHKYGGSAFIQESQPLNEGVTEYFARQVIAQVHPTLTRRNYQEHTVTTTALVGLVGEGVVARAYFDDNIAGLRNRYNSMHRKTQGTNWFGSGMKDQVWNALGGSTPWREFCELCSDEDWSGAKAKLQAPSD